MCPTDGGTFAYCNQTPNSSLKMIGINYLYTESDTITDLLVDLCSHYNDILSLYFRFLVYNNILLVKSVQNKNYCLPTLGLWR